MHVYNAIIVLKEILPVFPLAYVGLDTGSQLDAALEKLLEKEERGDLKILARAYQAGLKKREPLWALSKTAKVVTACFVTKHTTNNSPQSISGSSTKHSPAPAATPEKPRTPALPSAPNNTRATTSAQRPNPSPPSAPSAPRAHLNGTAPAQETPMTATSMKAAIERYEPLSAIYLTVLTHKLAYHDPRS